MTKYLFTLVFFLWASVCLTAQEGMTALEAADKLSVAGKGDAIIYGLFVQRLENNRGFPQYVILENTDNEGEAYLLRIKTKGKSRENAFCAKIAPGNYRITHYYWVEGKWWGSTAHTEPIFIGITADEDFNKRLENEEIKSDDLKMYSFTILSDKLYYMGTWHFDNEMVSFTDDKVSLDTILANKYPLLDFTSASTVIPK